MIRLFLLLVLGSFFSIGCAGLGPKLQFTDTQDNALVVGYLDTDKTPSTMDYIEYEQVSPKLEKPDFYFRWDKNAFYREDIAAGSYKLFQWGGHNKNIFTQVSQYQVAFPDEFTFEVGKPGKIYFLGSYKAVQKGNDLLSLGGVEYQKLEHPNELEVLQMILPDAAGSPWEPVIQKAIQALGGSSK